MGNFASGHLYRREWGCVVAVILLVEDEEQVRVLAESFLETAGHTTLSAGSIEQAFALLASPEPIDLLFIDLNLKRRERSWSVASRQSRRNAARTENPLHVWTSRN
jgi:CheY-like chemotaxis protein